MDKKRNIGFLGIAAALAFALLLAAPAAQVATVDNLLSLSQLTVSPSPVVAGGNVTISFILFNSYSDSLSNVNLALQANNQIVNVSPSHSYIVDSIGSGVYGGLGYNVFTYRFHVPSTLSSGLYTIDVVANYEAPVSASQNMPGTSLMPITLYIYGLPKISFNVVPQSPLVPGSLFDFQLSTVNTGTDTASNVSIGLISSRDFNLSGQTAFSLGSLPPGGSAQSSVSAIVASNISAGAHNLTIDVGYRTAAANYSYAAQVPISISTGSPSIALSIASAVPQLLYSGSNQTLSLLVQNIGTGTAKDLTVALKGSSHISVQSSAASFLISSLAPGASVTETAVVSANSSVSNSSNYIGADVSYYNSNYQLQSHVNETVPINVAPSAVFQVESVNDSLYPGGAYLPIVLTIKNVGNQAAQQAELSLQSIYPITPVAGTAYVSYLAPGNETSVTFYVNVDQNGLQGQYLLTVYEQWRQANTGVNQAFSASNNYYAVVYKSASSGGTDFTPYIVAAAAIIIALVVVMRLRKRGKAKAKPAKAK
jgi:hypothetical protein